jgi:hypothetical protein
MPTGVSCWASNMQKRAGTAGIGFAKRNGRKKTTSQASDLQSGEGVGCGVERWKVNWFWSAQSGAGCGVGLLIFGYFVLDNCEPAMKS